MEWTEVNIYTATEAIELLTARLMDIGVKGFAIKDAEDFNEFLENKNGQWDYIEEDLMQLSSCETRQQPGSGYAFSYPLYAG